MTQLDGHLERTRRAIDAAVESYFERRYQVSPGMEKLEEAVRYSVFAGGKRFRPALSLLTAEAIGAPMDSVIPYALAVEFVHTYSLIHDDLPCMDNDDERRGKPTNHKVFGEDIALLAGDALLTEAFFIISDSYQDRSGEALQALRQLARASGLQGMVGGQATDLWAQKEKVELPVLQTMHAMKTGALIEAAVLGAAHLCAANRNQFQELQEFAAPLGLAFQVADDILDALPGEEQELGSYCALMGQQHARKFLEELSEQSLAALSSWDSRAEPLRDVVRFNRDREV